MNDTVINNAFFSFLFISGAVATVAMGAAMI